MGGQDGSARDLLNYDSTSNTLMAGIRTRPSERLELGLNLNWTESEAGLDPFDLPADDYVATHPTMAYDFSIAHTYSDLDLSRLDGQLDATYTINEELRMSFEYRYIDFTDDDPYLYDLSGALDVYTFVLGWSF
jgi:hypothetical protein